MCLCLSNHISDYIVDRMETQESIQILGRLSHATPRIGWLCIVHYAILSASDDQYEHTDLFTEPYTILIYPCHLKKTLY